jgi:hypothetical protein
MATGPTYINGQTGNITPTELSAVPSTFDDLSEVQAYLDALVGELTNSNYFDLAE